MSGGKDAQTKLESSTYDTRRKGAGVARQGELA